MPLQLSRPKADIIEKKIKKGRYRYTCYTYKTYRSDAAVDTYPLPRVVFVGWVGSLRE